LGESESVDIELGEVFSVVVLVDLLHGPDLALAVFEPSEVEVPDADSQDQQLVVQVHADVVIRIRFRHHSAPRVAEGVQSIDCLVHVAQRDLVLQAVIDRPKKRRMRRPVETTITEVVPLRSPIEALGAAALEVGVPRARSAAHFQQIKKIVRDLVRVQHNEQPVVSEVHQQQADAEMEHNRHFECRRKLTNLPVAQLH